MLGFGEGWHRERVFAKLLSISDSSHPLHKPFSLLNGRKYVVIKRKEKWKWIVNDKEKWTPDTFAWK